MIGLAMATVAGVVDASGDARTISLYHIHTKETLTVLYKKDGRYLPDALKKINWIMRDWRRNQSIEMDPRTIDIIWEMHTELGSAQPIHIICGYRSAETNDMLRRTRGGQASQSQHITGKAIDVSFPDVPIRRLRYSAMIRERGGVGYYPTSALPFVHVDTGRVRSWPRMPHDELALLFPGGRSQYTSAEGRSLEPGDVAAARRRQPQLAQQVAQFFDVRANPRKAVLVASAGDAVLPAPAPRPAVRPERRPEPARPATVVAALGPLPRPAPPRPPEPRLASLTRDEPKPQPRLVREPRLVERSSRFTTGPSTADRQKLDELVTLAALDPAGGAEGARALPKQAVAALAADTGLSTPPTTFVAAPAFDDDHPEELAYQPFPIVPLLTETASADDPALARMVHPNVARTLDMIDDEGRILPMRFRPGEQTAQLLLAKQFTGQAVDLSAVEAYVAQQAPASAGLAERVVKTSPR